MDVIKAIEFVRTKQDLADFVSHLRSDFMENPIEWENQTLDRYFDAMESWIRVIDNYAENSGDADVRHPSWRTFAKILAAAKAYE